MANRATGQHVPTGLGDNWPQPGNRADKPTGPDTWYLIPDTWSSKKYDFDDFRSSGALVKCIWTEILWRSCLRRLEPLNTWFWGLKKWFRVHKMILVICPTTFFLRTFLICLLTQRGSFLTKLCMRLATTQISSFQAVRHDLIVI